MGSILSGIIFLAIGLIVRVYPNILAGYNSLSQKERENTERNGLPFYGFLLFTAMGVISLLSYVISRWLEAPHLSSGITLIVTLVGAIIAVVGGNYLINNRIN
ncbi:DUF3784 domain-containing protein [Algoriphagus hitonicola]|uniref:DUF3784 domain-containing protein n=1 Tax=Algoriphagus hitonicola TaxID=435880 RepID=A0A1I2PA65_9BACT|nr:DUF3784 domain-containing protein [Algoriphagus hitonicola]SFG13042.1 protein of unknown function [Algoriphagus hitonicola]